MTHLLVRLGRPRQASWPLATAQRRRIVHRVAPGRVVAQPLGAPRPEGLQFARAWQLLAVEAPQLRPQCEALKRQAVALPPQAKAAWQILGEEFETCE